MDELYNFVDPNLSWPTAAVTVAGLAWLAYDNEKRLRASPEEGSKSLKKVRVSSVYRRNSQSQSPRSSRSSELSQSAPADKITKRRKSRRARSTSGTAAYENVQKPRPNTTDSSSQYHSRPLSFQRDLPDNKLSEVAPARLEQPVLSQMSALKTSPIEKVTPQYQPTRASRRISIRQRKPSVFPDIDGDFNTTMHGMVAPGDELARKRLQAKLGSYNNNTVCDSDYTTRNTHQPWRLVYRNELLSIIPWFDISFANHSLPFNFHMTFNVLHLILDKFACEFPSDQEILKTMRGFGSLLEWPFIDVEYMEPMVLQAEMGELQRLYWKGLAQWKFDALDAVGVVQLDVGQFWTAGEEYFASKGWKMQLPGGKEEEEEEEGEIE